MATRKKTARKASSKKATRTKTPARKATRKKAAKKAAPRKTAGKKTVAKKAKRKATPKKTPKKAAKKPAARKAPAAAARKKPDATAALVRKILAAAADPSKFVIEDLYAPDCVSIEGNGMRVEGHAGLREKNAGWEAGLESATWNARNVLTGPNSIAIEWDAQIKFKDGRSLQMNEMAIHELRGGKIVAERYFYDPTALAPPAAEPEPPPAPEPQPEPAAKASYTPDPQPTPASADDDIDPMDL